eukprot:TRINITY_DN1528_c0_g1_i11.p3 TRINITY_DN1528_c0_g1~~TRINITY_DN1528_c0_g1_i11.p3  ORF type:complete len:156 (-),score=18.56 TRINITY_DN1528_c0_g1_i11:332-799(-)
MDDESASETSSVGATLAERDRRSGGQRESEGRTFAKAEVRAMCGEGKHETVSCRSAGSATCMHGRYRHLRIHSSQRDDFVFKSVGNWKGGCRLGRTRGAFQARERFISSETSCDLIGHKGITGIRSGPEEDDALGPTLAIHLVFLPLLRESHLLA